MSALLGEAREREERVGDHLAIPLPRAAVHSRNERVARPHGASLSNS